MNMRVGKATKIALWNSPFFCIGCFFIMSLHEWYELQYHIEQGDEDRYLEYPKYVPGEALASSHSQLQDWRSLCCHASAVGGVPDSGVITFGQ